MDPIAEERQRQERLARLCGMGTTGADVQRAIDRIREEYGCTEGEALKEAERRFESGQL